MLTPDPGPGVPQWAPGLPHHQAMPTNAQTALTAAATLYSGAAGYSNYQAIVATADAFKAWLDKHDEAEAAKAEPEQRDTTLDAMVERSEPTAPPELHRDYREEPLYRSRRIGFGN